MWAGRCICVADTMLSHLTHVSRCRVNKVQTIFVGRLDIHITVPLVQSLLEYYATSVCKYLHAFWIRLLYHI